MAIPPFPSQDLAKLVLGYLAEEQLMTAYDEFLQASPYLDVFRNEYDRILMTSLKSILAEYRAVKIYLESCKPHLLRKKLFQCSNLLEIFKFLVTYVDINRLHAQECTTEKISLKQSYVKSIGCEVCASLSLGACICKRNIQPLPTLQPSQIVCSLRTSTETTPLEDLPGNSVNNSKKNNNNEVLSANFLPANAQAVSETRTGVKTNVLATHGSQVLLDVNQEKSQVILNTQDVLTANLIETQENKNRNNFNTECNKDYLLAQKPTDSSDVHKSICNAGSFQNFAIGVSGSKDSEKPIVPDSSTSENYNLQSTTTKDNRTNINPITNIKGPPKPQFLNKLPTPLNKETRHQKTRTTKPKPNEQKIKIISDVKLGDTVRKNMLIMPPLQPISSPLLQMQRIVINGNNNGGNGNFKYNKDEIMAMPTIILVPASGPPNKTTTTPKLSNNIPIETTLPSIPNSLGPLVVDVSSNSSNTEQDKDKEKDIKTQETTIPVEKSLVKTVDLTHNSLPKDNNMAISDKTSTPNILPPARKSSSTPRRTSHVRVLDFTTPRRILHETINEQDKLTDKLVINEVIDLDNPNISNVDNVEHLKVESEVLNVSTKENNVKEKKKNWDDELRMLAVRNDESIEDSFKPRSKSKNSRTIKKTPMSEKNNEKSDKTDVMSCTKKSSPKIKKTKKTVKSVDIIKEPVVHIEIEEPVVEPTVNIISKSDWNILDNLNKENNENQVKMNNSDDRTETPDAERLSLQNVIGAKLNISELLETPYKQVLYDIQMETPKFLGPDLPGEPISDIKIMNIPTPKFFDTPKLVQATPSSYTSRPTDYSSGGSYYKPDDQDFVPEILNFDDTIVKEKDSRKKEKTESKVEEKGKVERSSRPQRKCTRNVSYRSPSTRAKDDIVIPVTSTCTSTSSRDKRTKSTDSKNKSKSKSVIKKKGVPIKSPFRKESILLKSTPNRIKIRPFKTTPSKELSGKKKRLLSSQTYSSKSLSKNRISKDKIHVTPVTLAAPTKSRRKSSTPRKLDTNTYEDNTDNTSSDLSKSDQDIVKDCPQDSDSDRPLQLSEEGSSDSKPAENVEDELNNIKEYIESTTSKKADIEGSLHSDLVKRGFDVETAKKIERDLLDATGIQDTAVQSTSHDLTLTANSAQNVSDKLESDCSTNNLQIVQDEDFEEIELSVGNCYEESDNYITYQFNEAEFVPKSDVVKLKDKFSMEVCIDDDVSIRFRSTDFKVLFEEDSVLQEEIQETEDAVNSISNFDKLYTPLKNRKTQCCEIFDSTLTSIDTPLKGETQASERFTEIILEVENIEIKEKTDTKKRKRITSEAAEESINKKSKADAQYLLNSANIQNIDIESVLSKLHGP